jgi:hypothetical protein
MTAAQPLLDYKKFWIGFLGGLAPYLVRLATFCYTVTEYSAFPSWPMAIFRVIGVVLFSLLGGITAAVWGDREKELKRIFVMGMGAPAILASVLANAQAGLRPPL